MFPVTLLSAVVRAPRVRPLWARALGVCAVVALAVPLEASSARVNFAKYQRVESSVHTSTYVADFAVDGRVSNFNAYRTGNQAGPLWLEVNYPRPITLASAHLYLGWWEQATPTEIPANFRLQYHSGLDWVDIPGSSVTGNTQTERVLTFASAVTAQRFRFFSTDAGARTVREVAFFPPNVVSGTEQGFPLGTDVTLNLAALRPATSSSAVLNNAYGAGYAKNAFDGYLDNTSRWLANNQAAGEYLEVDLLALHRLGSAHVYTGFIEPTDPSRVTMQPMANFTLQYWNGSTWLPIPGAEITGNTDVARAIEFSETVTTSRVRLVTTSAFNARVQELLLFPPRAGGYALGREVLNAVPPAATWETLSDSTYRLRNRGPDLRLGLVNGQVIFTSAATLPAETIEWQLLLNHRDGTYRVRHPATGRCLALGAVSPQPGVSVVAEDYSGLPHQDWRLEFVDATRFRLVNVYSGHVLQSQNGSWTAGTPAVVGAFAESSTVQLWSTTVLRHHPKKGIAGTNNVIRTSTNPYVTDSDLTFIEDFHRRLRGTWSYTWGRQTSDAFPFMDFRHTFNPMQWGAFNMAHGSPQGPLDRIHRDLQSSAGPMHLLGFNEPEKTDQSNVSVASAIALWPRLEAQQVPLVSPVPASAFNGWMADFVAQADARGFRRDFTAVHWYGNPNATSLINHLQSNYTTFGRPVWLTEFSVVRWSGTTTWTEADNFNFLAEFLWRAEALTWLKRYSLFAFIANSVNNPNQSAPDPVEAPRSNALRADGSLTPFGELYAGWDGVTEVLADRAYHLHNVGGFERAENPGGTAAPTFVNPNIASAGNQWFLSLGITANTHRLISTRDGRPLRFVDGGTVNLGAVGETGPAVEWRTVADLHGVYYIEHPASNKRLRRNSNGSYGMFAITTTDSATKWRLVRPAVSDVVGAPSAPEEVLATAQAGSITVQWSAVTGATRYTVRRATAANGPWSVVAENLTAPGWSDSDLPPTTTYFYQVTATNLYALESAASPTATATTPAALSPYEAWAANTLAQLAEAARVPNADPDTDGLSNLLEFALGENPTVPAASSPLQLGYGAQQRLQLTFLRARAEMRYEVLASADLGTWTVIADNPGAVGESVTVTDTVALGTAGARFLRLRVSTAW